MHPSLDYSTLFDLSKGDYNSFPNELVENKVCRLYSIKIECIRLTRINNELS